MNKFRDACSLLFFCSFKNMLRTTIRSFYTYSQSQIKPCQVLPDGSKLIARESKLQKPIAEIKENLLPPRVHRAGKKDSLTALEIEEATLLRKLDPLTWTVKALSEKFDVDRDYIRLRIPTSREYAERLENSAKDEFDALGWNQKRRILNRMRKRTEW